MVYDKAETNSYAECSTLQPGNYKLTLVSYYRLHYMNPPASIRSNRYSLRQNIQVHASM